MTACLHGAAVAAVVGIRRSPSLRRVDWWSEKSSWGTLLEEENDGKELCKERKGTNV